MLEMRYTDGKRRGWHAGRVTGRWYDKSGNPTGYMLPVIEAVLVNGKHVRFADYTA